MTEHAPTPWRLDDDMIVSLDPSLIGDMICCAPDSSEYEDSRKHWPANAAFIVKACNAFPDLVKALEMARARIEYLGAACASSKHFEANYETFLPAIDEVLGRVKGVGTP